ncbi:hypothetical protein PTSG_07483 [Salpingoeca rosetta]|uniref:C2 domain-containing protein n=1 Tax=Salpingoeca rosetta (strain ATCC 50818 / BSB-021) TaxID=946362 RepID=F2UIV1_SALR5|nr:uncharacterized protein PTSG_07483 [Salpingoeca rosetta]EGD77150.1 hypothetical protein PTSG_07483 [Salpingoeca rosetta]|eukprot:XP_004990989.1 hypothetical protein PTSG_07483 [Salpingoeca rosetta]
MDGMNSSADNADNVSIRSDRSTRGGIKSTFSKLFRRRRPPQAYQQQQAQQARTDERMLPNDTDVAAIYAIRHAQRDDDDETSMHSFGPEESMMASSPTPGRNPSTSTRRSSRGNAHLSASVPAAMPRTSPGGARAEEEDELCRHNYQHEQPYGTSTRRKLPTPAAKFRSKSDSATTSASTEGLHVLLQSASGIMAADRGGTSDPFVTLRLGKQKHTSRTISKTLEPKWDDEFFFKCERGNGQDVLRVDLYDRDRFGTDYLGSVTIPLTDVPLETPTPLSVRLQDDGRRLSRRLPSDLGVLNVTLTRTFDQSAKQKVRDAANVKEGVNVLLRGGRDLMVADRGGTSDPFAIVRLGRHKHTSRTQQKTINPDWNEEFFLQFDNGPQHDSLVVDVFDRDRFGTDYMGTATLDLKDFDLDKPRDVEVELADDGRKTSKPLPSALGRLLLTVTRVQTRAQGKKLRRTKTTDMGLSDTRVVDVKLLQGKNLLQMDANGEADPYVKVTIGQQTKKSKVVYKNRISPTWNQAFRFEVHDKATIVKFEVYDKDLRKDEFMGVATLSLADLPRDEAHRRWLELKQSDGFAGEIQVVISVSNPFAQADDDDDDVVDLSKQSLYCGHLRVHVRSARGLAAKDAGRSSDPFVVCELGNKRKRTSTKPKTCNPTWNETLNFNVLDVFDVVRITVYDEDRGGKTDFLGALIIPLLEIKSGRQELYTLKAKTLDKAYKGQLVLTLDLNYKPIPSYLRLIKKREVRFFEDDAKLRIGVLRQNVQRVRALIEAVLAIFRNFDRLFNWDFGVPRTIVAMVFWVWATLYMYFYHVPFFFALYLLYRRYFSRSKDLMWLSSASDEEEEEEEAEEGEEKKKERRRAPAKTAWYTALKNIALEVQNRLGDAASMGEKVKNFFNWSVPTITGIITVVALVAAFILFLIPLRYILLVWGIRRFVKKGRMKYFPPKNIDRHREPVSEIKELLGRIPDDLEKVQRQRLFPGRGGAMSERQTSKSSLKSSAGGDDDDDDDDGDGDESAMMT